MASTPEVSLFTSVRARVVARQRHRAVARMWAMVAAGETTVEQAATALNRAGIVDDYLTLVDLTGRVLRTDKRGAIDPRLSALLSPLNLKLDAWIATMTGWRQMHGRALGHREVRDEMAERYGLRSIRNRCPLFAHRAAS